MQVRTTLPVATPDDEAYFSAASRTWDPAIRARIILERAVIRRAMTDLVAAGYMLRLNDGEDWSHEPTSDVDLSMAALMATDEERLYAYKHFPEHAAWKPIGSILLVYGNDGYDVIADNSLNLEEALTATAAYSDALADLVQQEGRPAPWEIYPDVTRQHDDTPSLEDGRDNCNDAGTGEGRFHGRM